MKKKGIAYVLIQFIAIFILLFYSNFYHYDWLLSLRIVGIVLGLSAIWEVRSSKFSVFPELKRGACLIQTGPYKFIRHPMYSAILLFFIPTIVNAASIYSFIVFVVLLVNLVLKMSYEEKILKQEFKEYEQYSKKTYYIIPYIY